MATDRKSWEMSAIVSPESTWGAGRGRWDAIWYHEHAPAGGPRPVTPAGDPGGGGPAQAAAAVPPKPDPINPAHYGGIACKECGAEIQPWPFCERLGFNLGNVLKYLWRAGRKGDRIEDLRKAARYLMREIAEAEAAENAIGGPF